MTESHYGPIEFLRLVAMDEVVGRIIISQRPTGWSNTAVSAWPNMPRQSLNTSSWPVTSSDRPLTTNSQASRLKVSNVRIGPPIITDARWL